MRGILTYVLIFLVSSCGMMFPHNLTDNAFYDIDDASVRLVVKHPADTLYKTSYDLTHNLPGKYFKLLSTTKNFDTTQQIGVQMKVWAKIVMNEKGTFYGYCPRNGLLNKIDKMTISLKNESATVDLAPYLKGDSTIQEVKWRICDYKKLPYTWGDCPYFEGVDQMKKSLNNRKALERIPSHEYILWIDKQLFKVAGFKPTTLQLKLDLVDSTGTKRRQITDSMRIE